MKFIEKQLDRFTMYQVVITVLSVWFVASVLLGLFDLVSGNWLEQILSLVVLMAIAVVTHLVCAYISKAPANLHSTIISALILYFLFFPATDVSEYLVLALVAMITILSKYIFAWKHLHIFNPVALAALLAGLFGLTYASWWIATPAMLPLVVIGGLAIVIKIKRLALAAAGLISALGVFVLVSLLHGSYGSEALSFFFLYTPIIFFTTVMLVEPLSTPGTKKLQIIYGIFTGALLSIPFSFGPIGNTPELTLLISNALFFGFSLRKRLTLTLSEMKEVARNTFEFSFTPAMPVKFLAGQYLEWTLPHSKPDARSVRRYFTIASSPTESDLKLTVRFIDNGSSFKKCLQSLEVGDKIYATARAGDFVLPNKVQNHKYIFIAGGIGVTPYRSFVREAIDKNHQLDAVMFYLNRNIEDASYLPLFSQASHLGLKLVNILDLPPKDWSGERGFLTKEILARNCPDFSERIAYISGPPGMVGAYKQLLRKVGIPDKNIKTDYFPGLA